VGLYVPLLEFNLVAWRFSICLGRDHGGFAGLRQWLQYPFVGIVALVRNDEGCCQSGQQRVGSFSVAGLSRRQQEAGRVAQRIHRGMNFRAQPAFAAPERLVGTVFL
jgi:hypothetical protein